uniref:Uncharacterized protein n=1 Tax=Arundo donax TaxID=35708 RepID=A0A0A8ZLX5_ARUDO
MVEERLVALGDCYLHLRLATRLCCNGL